MATTTTTTTTTPVTTSSTTPSVQLTGNYSLLGLRSETSTNTSVTTSKVTGIYTDTILQVTLTGNSTGTVSNSGATITQTCVSFNVAIYNSQTNQQIGGTQTAYVNTNGGSTCADTATGTNYSPDGQAHPMVDFSAELGSGIQAPINVVISDAYSDACGPNLGTGNMQTLEGYYGYEPIYENVSCWRQLYNTWTVTGGYTITTNSLQ